MLSRNELITSTPRIGIKGHWDKFIGPGASMAENLVALVPAVVFGGFVVAMAFYQKADWHLGLYFAACFLAFDMVGGIATTATRAAKTWYHRPEQTWQQHLKFIVPHTAHLALFGWLFVGDNLLFFAVFLSLLLVGSLVILSSSLKIRRSIAHLWVFVAVILSQLDFDIDPLMLWFVPALFIKLFASYLPADGFQERDSK